MKNLFWLVFVLFLSIEIYPQQKIGKHTLPEWRYIIDTTWGEGQTTAEKLQIFDAFWNTIDQKYAGFNGIDDSWQELKSCRDTVALGVSRGRFAGILSYLAGSLHDAHTQIWDQVIALTALNEGVPLLYAAGTELPSKNWGAASHFGAALTPLPDSSLLVYSSVLNHPLGLVPGDIILGYDGRLWKNLYKELIEVHFPNPFAVPCTSPRAALHGWLQCAGMNWHLFDTIDVVKYATEDTLHLPTALLSNPMPGIHATEQLPVEGVPFPDVAGGHHVSWGYINGSKIGYIYVWGWNGMDGSDFSNAVNAFMPDSSSDGLVIDLRLNEGGSKIYQTGFRRLFNQNVETMRSLVRDNPLDHLSMKDNGDGGMYFSSDSELFDRPIAVLCGPSTISAGDQSVNVLREHPMVRTFGFPTNGGFGSRSAISGISNEWFTAYTYRVYYSPPDINNNLNHKSIPVDEEIWLTRDGVASGQDDVVLRSLAWINNLVYPHNIITDKSYYSPEEDTVHIYTTIENPNSHQLSSRAYIKTFEGVLIDSIDLGKQTSTEGSEQWTGDLILPNFEEFYNISVTAFDQMENTSFTLPNATRVTTVGPIIIESFTVVEVNDSLIGLADFKLVNNGSVKTIENVKATLKTTDTCVTNFTINNAGFGNIAAGDSKTVSAAFGFNISSCAEIINFELDISSDGIFYWTESFTVDIPTDIEEGISQLPTKFALSQNYPNPFNPSTTIKYKIPLDVKRETLPTGRQAKSVKLVVYDILGREVAVLVNQRQKPGNYEVEFQGSELTSGVYFYQLTAGEFVETKKLILLK